MDRESEFPARPALRRAAGGRGLIREAATPAPAPRASARAVDRMLLALRVYEQRALARARLRQWVTTRRAVTDAGRA